MVDDGDDDDDNDDNIVDVATGRPTFKIDSTNK